MILSPKDREFANFHAHTFFSTQDALTSPDDLVVAAKELGHTSCCISEHGHMASFPIFVKACEKHGLNFRLATEFYFQWDHQKKEKSSHHLLVIVKNEAGYRNLLALHHASNIPVDKGGGFFGRPRITEKMLEQHAEGLIIGSACLSGPVTQHLWKGDRAQAILAAEYFRDTFQDFYLEMMPHKLEAQAQVNKKIDDLGKELGIPVITTLDVHFKDKSYETAYLVNGDIRRSRTKADRADPNSDCLRDPDFWYKSPEEIITIYDAHGIPLNRAIESFRNTLDIDSMIDFKWENRHFDFPVFCEEADKVLAQMIADKSREMFNGSVPEDVKARLREEFQVIRKMGYSNYFLILEDCMSFCDRNGIVRGPGRGSAGACMILYVLGIVRINPMEYNLAFSRFLNVYRKSAPDVDIDLEPAGRVALIGYLQKKYGKDRIVQVANYSKMQPKAAIKDVCKWLDLDFKIANEITSHIPSKEYDDEGNLTDLSWEDAMAHVDDAVKEKHHEVFDIGEKLAGSYRTFSKHAGAVCVLPSPAQEIIPVMKGKNDDDVDCFVSQWNKNLLEGVGIHKYDFLGLSTLTVLRECEELTGVKVGDIPLDDVATWEFIRAGRFMEGIFQLAEPKTQRYLRDISPKTIQELSDVNTLIRPGSDYNTYIENKKSGKIIYKYELPEVVEELEKTYGAIIYQESIINLASKLSGMDLGEGDLVRRALEKGKKDDIDFYRAKFKETCKYPELADQLFEWLLDSAGYLFNCIQEDSIVTMADGSEKKIKDVQPGDWINSFDENGDKVLNMSLGYFEKGERECLKIVTVNGLELVCTPDHKIFIGDGESVPASELMKSDMIESYIKVNDIYYERIESIENVGLQKVGDISLVNHPNNFLANRILVKNCSHGLSYSVISYFSSFFKANYPNEFLIANLRHPKSDSKNTESENIGTFVQEARSMGIDIKTSTISDSHVNTSLSGNSVVIGLENLVGLTEKSAALISGAKATNFEDLVDELTSLKIDTKAKKDGSMGSRSLINKKHIWRLVQIGYFGDFEEYRQRYITKLELKEKDEPPLQTKSEAINEALGFEFFNRVTELWAEFEPKILKQGRDVAEYKILKLEKVDKKTGQYGDYFLVKADSNTGKLTAFVSGGRGKKLPDIKKGDFCLVKCEHKDESTIRVKEIKVLS